MTSNLILTPYTFIPPKGDEVKGEIEWPKNPGYEKIKELVEPYVGGWLEHVYVLNEGKQADMFVNENGHMLKLPFNLRATTLYRAASLKRWPGMDPKTLPIIVGPAVVFHRPVWS